MLQKTFLKKINGQFAITPLLHLSARRNTMPKRLSSGPKPLPCRQPSTHFRGSLLTSRAHSSAVRGRPTHSHEPAHGRRVSGRTGWKDHSTKKMSATTFQIFSKITDLFFDYTNSQLCINWFQRKNHVSTQWQTIATNDESQFGIVNILPRKNIW